MKKLTLFSMVAVIVVAFVLACCGDTGTVKRLEPPGPPYTETDKSSKEKTDDLLPPDAAVPLGEIVDMSLATAAERLGVETPKPDANGPPDLAWAPGDTYYSFGEVSNGVIVGGYWANPGDDRAKYVQALFYGSYTDEGNPVLTKDAYAICGLPPDGYERHHMPNPLADELGAVLTHETLPGKYIDVQFHKAGSEVVDFIRVSTERKYVYFEDALL
jgi:hypothetical protein